MVDLGRVARIPNVASAVLGDMAGGFYDAIREADGETVAAVAGFISTSLVQVGEQLGLGPLGRVSLTGPTRAFVIVAEAGSTITLGLDSPASLPAVERALDSSFGSRG